MTAEAAMSLGVANGPSPQTGAPLGPFLVYPELTIGAVYNDNLYPAATRRQIGLGVSIAPRLKAIDDDGLHKTSLYFSADAELFPGAGGQVPASRRSAVSLALSAQHGWSPTPDLSLAAAAAFTRQNTLLQTPANVETRFIPAPSVLNLTAGAGFLDRTEAELSVQRSLGAGFFVGAGGRIENVAYEAAPAAGGPAGGRTYSASLRIGHALTPTLSGFVEANAHFERRVIAAFDNDVDSLVVGLSSDLISLFRGEIDAGFQRQTSPRGAFASLEAPTFGARLFYYPTTYLTLAASLDRAFAFNATAPVGAAGGPAASPDLWQARLQADYAFAAYWRASASVAWARATSLSARQTAWLAGAQFNYDFWRNLDLTLTYQFARLGTSGGAIRGYDQNIGSLGLTYKY